MNDQYMLTDLGRTSEAFLVFSLIAVAPGYVFAWWLNILAFRRRMLLTRLTIALPVSIGICPILTYVVWRFLPPAVLALYGACAVAFIVLMFHERRELLSRAAMRTFFKRGRVFLAIIAGWGVLAELTLVDLQIGRRLYFPTVSYDYSLRSAVTSSITRSGIPAHNPFFFPGRLFVMHYHYFWLTLCSLAERMTGSAVSSRHAVNAGTIWCGIALAALVALYLRFFEARRAEGIERRTLIAIGLLSVTGLDIVPVILIEIQSRGYFADFEWWNNQIAAWIETAFWTPHNLAALIACLAGFLLLWDAARLPRARDRILLSSVAGLMFSSSVGLSIYVTLVFAIFLVVWMIMAFLRSHRGAAGLICLAGLTTVALSIPFLTELLGKEPGAAKGHGDIPLEFAVRTFKYFDNVFGLTGNGWRTNLANLMVLPINYGLELGFFLIVAVIQSKRMWRGRKNLPEEKLCALTMAMTSIVICTFVSSGVITGNDLGWRGFLPAQFILLIWGAELLADGLLTSQRSRDKRILIMATLALGVAGSFYALVKIRFYPIMSDMTSTPLYAWLSPDRSLGVRTFAVRQIYEEMKRLTPASAIFQHNPHTAPEDFFEGLYGDRQVAAEGLDCGVFFGGDASVCQSRIGAIDGLFEDPKAFDATQIDDVCARNSINVLVVKDTDKVWRDRGSWVWNRTPVVENSYARAFMCGPSVAPPLIQRSNSTAARR